MGLHLQSPISYLGHIRSTRQKMNVVPSPHDMSALVDRRRQAGRRQVLVPTMGALHEGHLRLVEEGLRHGDDLTVSIFVNPTQFAAGEDYGRYPRELDDDMRRLNGFEREITVFAPTHEAMYPGGKDLNVTWVCVDGLDRHLCGPHRPGHFTGVTTVVAKLFNICRPHAAVFGLKDAQQFVILKRMVRDLHFGIDMVGVPTVREEDGLAYSSRNVFLTPEERAQATVLSNAVLEAERLICSGEQHSEALVESMHFALEEAPLARIEYAEVVDAETLHPIDRVAPGQHILAAVAAYFGSTRLIDSVFVRAPAAAGESNTTS